MGNEEKTKEELIAEARALMGGETDAGIHSEEDEAILPPSLYGNLSLEEREKDKLEVKKLTDKEAEDVGKRMFGFK